MTPDVENSFLLLGVPKGSTEDEIKAAWRVKVFVAHPDQGGDAEVFQALKAAYDVCLLYAHTPAVCEKCFGRGRVQVGRGASFLWVDCPDCGGRKATKDVFQN